MLSSSAASARDAKRQLVEMEEILAAVRRELEDERRQVAMCK